MAYCSKGHLIPPDAPENLCPRCLLYEPDPSPAVPRRIGPFHVLGQLGEGGFGLVYRARREGASGSVALKVLRDVRLADEAAITAFRNEATVLASLSSRYVVQVFEAGEYQGEPYFTMEYLPGGTLRERIASYRDDPRRAAELMVEIATAVQYLHRDPDKPERPPILHRDLKPENILFGEDGRPRLSDFGIAKLAKDGTWALSRPVGCPAYMAPEQLYPAPRRELTAAADVYALGVILYELFTGRTPFDGANDAELLARLRDDEPPPPRLFVPKLDRFLETVVLNALEKDPTRRYRSAAGFAQDLRRALEGKPPEEAPPVPTGARLASWVRRRPLTAALGLWAILLVCVVGATWRATVVARAKSLDRDQQTNAAVAGMQAVAVNLQLRAYKHRIEELARDPSVVELLMTDAIGNPSPVLVERLEPFDGMFVMGPDGVQRARTSHRPRDYMERSFTFRGYFQGARRLAAEVCRPDPSGGASAARAQAFVARAHLSESDGRFEFAVSTPLCRGSTWLGVLAASVTSDKVLGAVRVLDDANRVAAVLGPRDRDRSAAHLPLPTDLWFIVHPGLTKGQLVPLHRPDPAVIRTALGLTLDSSRGASSERLRYAAPLRVDDYHDPNPGYDGAWAAVFASADESDYIVAVASRRDVTPVARAVLEKLAVPAGLPFSVALLLLSLLALARSARSVPARAEISASSSRSGLPARRS